MLKKSTFRLAAFLVTGVLILTACKPGATLPTDDIKPTSESTSEASTSTDSVEITETPTEITPEPTPIPIVDNRLPPEQWQQWPVIPELTGREKAIYLQGLSQGNDPQHFSKVGDCQAIKEVLMGIYDIGRYSLDPSDAHLQETIDYFAGSFDRDGQGVRGGFNTAAVLNPLWADPTVCEPGENPIECENRTHNPSYVIISLEVWWEGRTVERYEEYMRQIIDFYIEQGVVPILSTKADNVEGDHKINLATARLAYEYHLPLWNFWLAVQGMPNHGIDPDRDGFHISYEAWTIRSFTALQALDAVWRGVRDTNGITEITPVPTEESMVEFAEIQFSPALVPGPISSNSNRIFFSIEQRQDETTQSAGVFAYDITAKTLYQILGEGYQLEDVNATGSSLLVSLGAQLFMADSAGNLTPVTDKLALTGRDASAFWLPDGVRLAVLTEEADRQTLSLVDPASGAWQTLAEGQITGMIKPANDTTFYWYAGQCSTDNGCDADTLWRTQNGVSESYAELSQAAFSADSSAYTWIEDAESDMFILYTRQSTQTAQDYIYLPGNRMMAMVWAPFGTRLVIMTSIRDDYTGKTADARVFMVESNGMTSREHYAFPGLNPSATWSPDGGSLLLTSILAANEGYESLFRLMDMTSGAADILDKTLKITSTGYININHIYWFTP
jgi:hypothetical protein